MHMTTKATTIAVKPQMVVRIVRFSFDGRRFQARIALLCELDDFVDRSSMRSIGFRHLQIASWWPQCPFSMAGRKNLHGLPKILCRS